MHSRAYFDPNMAFYLYWGHWTGVGDRPIKQETLSQCALMVGIRLINTKNYDVIKERHSIHHMIILTLLPLAHANVENNTFPMIYYKGLRNQS